jgi:hypothetical protein
MKQYKHHGGSLRRDHGGCTNFWQVSALLTE